MCEKLNKKSDVCNDKPKRKTYELHTLMFNVQNFKNLNIRKFELKYSNFEKCCL